MRRIVVSALVAALFPLLRARAAEKLTLPEAEALALKNNPQISAARLIALAEGEHAREVKSGFLPTLSANATGVDASPGTRITAGALNNPVLYDRAAAGAVLNQLLTDFGRTSNLLASARFRARAQDALSTATAEQVTLAVDQAFYGGLAARALLKVAQQTVAARRDVADQVRALAQSKLKSDLDTSFAEVDLAQANLLLLDSENGEKAAIATLSAILGFSDDRDFDLVEVALPIRVPPANADELIARALAQRPDVAALTFESRAAEKYRVAQRDQFLPELRAVAVGGFAPYRNDHLSANYSGVGVNLAIPIFTGFRVDAEAREAELRARAAGEKLLDVRNQVARDVRKSWLDLQTAYSRLSVTRELLRQADRALDLARTRYRLGLSSIVELSQAQLKATEAEIGDADARYRYRLAEALLRYEVGPGPLEKPAAAP